MSDLPPFPGPRMVALLDGTMVWNDSEEWRHLCEARHIAAKPQHERDAWLADIQYIRGEAAAARLRATINEVIAVTAAGSR